MGYTKRTDLALEARELWSEAHRREGLPDGIRESSGMSHGFRVTRVQVTTPEGAETLCKPIGSYVTLELERLLRREDNAFQDGAEALAEEIRALLPLEAGACVLVAGLGNAAITPDAVGHLTLRSTLVTRHLTEELPEAFAGFRPVAAFEPGVLGTTGVESAELVRAVVSRIRPAAVIAVDALAARRTSRVCRTVQLTDTGISPGSGVGNARAALSRETLGVPVLAVGVPTVVDAATLAADLAEEAGVTLPEEALQGPGASLMVTPRDIDAGVADVSRLVGYGIDLALHDGLTPRDVDLFI